MKNKYVQSKGSKGCSLYCMSNLFNSPFIDYLNDETGEMNQSQENRILSQKYPGIELRYLAYMNSFVPGLKWPALTNIIEHIRRDENLDNTRFVAMQLTLDHGVLHVVNLYLCNHCVWISDPLNEGVQKISGHSNEVKKYLTNRYDNLYRIAAYCQITEDLEEELMFFGKEGFKHLFE